MQKGNPRREETADSLAGATQVVATPKAAPRLSAPSVSVPDVTNSFTARLGRQLGQWSTDKLQQMANTAQEAEQLEGQMAYAQGTAIEDTEMGGNKWALNGYRLMEAQTISSTMLASQQTLIQQKGYEDDPDTFRAQYVNQLEQQIAGLDAQTAKMVKETMTKHMPSLVSQHTAAHLTFKEGENFKTLAGSIDTISKDPTATDALVAAAIGGPGSVTAGLSDDRRLKAVAQGISTAFDNDNPLAYAKLAQAGVIDSLSREDKAAVEKAEAAYQTRKRSEYDAAYMEAKSALEAEMATGKYTPAQAVEARVKLDTEYDIETTSAEMKVAYLNQEDAVMLDKEADKVLVKAALARGDVKTAELIKRRIVERGGLPPLTAKGRLEAVQEGYKELTAQMDIAANEEASLTQTAIDASFEQHGNVARYRKETAANLRRNGVKQSAARSKAVLSNIKSYFDKQSAGLQADLKEAAQTQFVTLEIGYNRALQDKSLTRAEREALLVKFNTDANAIFDSVGISRSARNDSAIKQRSLTSFWEASDLAAEYEADGRVITRAAANGTIATLDKDLQTRYFSDQEKRIVETIGGQVQTGEITQEDARSQATQAIISAWASAGAVNPREANEASAAISRGVAEQRGGETIADPAAVQAIETYKLLKELSPSTADTFLSGEEQIIAENVLDMAASNSVQDGAIRYHHASLKPGGFDANRPVIDDAMRKRLKRGVKGFVRDNDAGFLDVFRNRHRFKTRLGSEEDILKSPETRDRLLSLMEEEALDIITEVPGASDKTASRMAAERVAARTSFVGESLVTLPKGKSIIEQAFGSQAHSIVRPGIEQELMLDYMRDLSKQPGFEYLTDFKSGRQIADNFLEIAQVLPLVNEPTGTPTDDDIIDVEFRGVIPFQVHTAGDNVFIVPKRQDGVPAQPIFVPLKEVGDAYIQKHKDAISYEDPFELAIKQLQ